MPEPTMADLVNMMLSKMKDVNWKLWHDGLGREIKGMVIDYQTYPHYSRMAKAKRLLTEICETFRYVRRQASQDRQSKRKKTKRLNAKRLALIDAANAHFAAMGK